VKLINEAEIEIGIGKLVFPLFFLGIVEQFSSKYESLGSLGVQKIGACRQNPKQMTQHQPSNNE
jgi:hypothetical protein